MTDKDIATLKAVATGLNGISVADDVARRLRIKNGRLAATSKLRALERKGLVGRIPPRDQWSSARWFLTNDGKAAILK